MAEELILRDAFLNYIIMSLCDVFVFWSMHKQRSLKSASRVPLLGGVGHPTSAAGMAFT